MRFGEYLCFGAVLRRTKFGLTACLARHIVRLVTLRWTGETRGEEGEAGATGSSPVPCCGLVEWQAGPEARKWVARRGPAWPGVARRGPAVPAVPVAAPAAARAAAPHHRSAALPTTATTGRCCWRVAISLLPTLARDVAVRRPPAALTASLKCHKDGTTELTEREP